MNSIQGATMTIVHYAIQARVVGNILCGRERQFITLPIFHKHVCFYSEVLEVGRAVKIFGSRGKTFGVSFTEPLCNCATPLGPYQIVGKSPDGASVLVERDYAYFWENTKFTVAFPVQCTQLEGIDSLRFPDAVGDTGKWKQ